MRPLWQRVRGDRELMAPPDSWCKNRRQSEHIPGDGAGCVGVRENRQSAVRKLTGKKIRKRNGPPKYIAIREQVLRRHGIDKESFHRIARELGVSEDTVRQSWDSAHREESHVAVAEGRTPNRDGYRHLAADKIKRMREMILIADGTSREIGVAVGVSTNTVQRERKRMLARRNNQASGIGSFTLAIIQSTVTFHEDRYESHGN